MKPAATIAFLTRTPSSVLDHGENQDAHWSPDGTKIVVQTTDSYMVLVSVEYKPDDLVYQVPTLAPQAQRNFLAGPGEGIPLQGVGLHFEGVIRIEGNLLSVSTRKHFILFSTRYPAVVQRIPWPTDESEDEAGGDDESQNKPAQERRSKPDFQGFDSWALEDYDAFSWLVESDVAVEKILFSRTTGVEAWITTDGRVYLVRLEERDDDWTQKGESQRSLDTRQPQGKEMRLAWHGTCVHDFETPKWVQKQKRIDPNDASADRRQYEEPKKAISIAVNGKFSLIAVGMKCGEIQFTNFPSQEGLIPKSQSVQIPNPYKREMGEVCSMEWSSDGYVLAVAWRHGWGIITVGGRCLVSCFGVEDMVDEDKFQDAFMYGAKHLFWAPGNFELFLLAQATPKRVDGQLFVIPFAKSATTGQHSPDNTRYAFLQMDDRALIYRGADQPDMSVINPESDVWQHIKIPQSYLATNWPIRYSSLSNDGRLIAIAGRRGLIHYSSTSGRWKMFNDEQQEQAFSVRGGLLWFHHVLIAAVEVSRSYQIRLYSRDMDLTNQNVLHREQLTSPVVILSLVDNSLLVYTSDNTLHHYLIVPTEDTIKLHLCGSITFSGIIMAPQTVGMLSWMIPSAQKQLGDPVDDLAVATVLMVVGGQLVLLRPRKSGDQEVKYDMQIFADRIEFCWIHLRGITALENSLWAYDGQGMRVWLNALTIEPPQGDVVKDNEVQQQDIKESVNIPLDFYPLSVLMDKGIIIGAEHEAATRSNLSFVMFRHATSSHLFLHHVLLYIVNDPRQVKDAVIFASHYKDLVYFAHALEILLHTVVESEAEDEFEGEDGSVTGPADSVLPTVVEFLDHFEPALDVVVGCARKTELTRWRRLFDIVGNPKTLFEICLASNRLKTAGSYLLVLHNLEQLDENNADAVRLLKSAVDGKDWQLCRELLRFLHSIDDTGEALRNALRETKILGVELNPSVSSIIVAVNGLGIGDEDNEGTHIE